MAHSHLTLFLNKDVQHKFNKDKIDYYYIEIHFYKQMADSYQINTFRSLSSENSEDEIKEIRIVQTKQNKTNKLYGDDLGDSFFEDKSKLKTNIEKSARKSSGCSDWDDTQQLQVSSKIRKKSQNSSSIKRTQANSNQKTKEPRKQIKYPQIKESSYKKIEINSFGQKNDRFDSKNNIERSESEQYSEEININVSMIGERPKGFKAVKKSQQKQEKKQKQEKRQKRQVQIKINKKPELNIGQPEPNPFRSVYMSGGAKKQQNQDKVRFKLMDNTMYWILKDKEVKISSQTIQALVEYFLKKQIMLPLISDEQFNSTHIVTFMKAYTQFLNNCMFDLFMDVFPSLKSQTVQSKAHVGIGVNAVTPRSSQKNLINNFFDKYVSKMIKNSNYSKSQLVRNHMIKKLSMASFIGKTLKNKTQYQQQIQGQKIGLLQRSLGLLELLVSFQNAQNYCKNESKEGIDHRIWKQHHKKIMQLRKKWISSLNQSDFLFLV